jgi:REP element-mobilizing transposase RayT
MPSIRISKNENSNVYFVTLTVKKWYYVLDRYFRWNILANSLKYLKENKNLKLYDFVFMINHIHLIIYSEDTIGFLRDFKGFTSKEIQKNIEKTEPNLLKLFLNEKNQFEFWEKTNMPKIIESENFYFQKVKYINDNPIKRGYVTQAEHWYWSSANLNCELKVDDINDLVLPETKGSGEDA